LKIKRPAYLKGSVLHPSAVAAPCGDCLFFGEREEPPRDPIQERADRGDLPEPNDDGIEWGWGPFWPFLVAFAAMLAALLVASKCDAQAPGRFGFDCDGNWHDRDDFAGSAISLHIVANAGASGRMVYFGINNHFPETRREWQNEMHNSTTRGPWAHPAIVDCRASRSTAVSRLRSLLASSTAANPYWHGMQGPPDIFYDAHRGVAASALRTVRLVSHSSSYNEQTGGVHSWDEIRYVEKKRIPNGNDRLNTRQNWAPWNGWMVPFDRQRLGAVGRADCSDATVAGYLVHGRTQTSIADLKLWIGQ
jgi:hypothetical protein